MGDNSYLDISIYHIRLFLLLAEHRNFSKAAAIAHVTQPTLSRRVAQLEQLLHIKLFDRNSRPVQLAKEGEMLYRGWKDVCSRIEQTINSIETGNCCDTLRIGVIDSADQIPSHSFEELVQDKLGIKAIHYHYAAKWHTSAFYRILNAKAQLLNSAGMVMLSLNGHGAQS